MQICKSREALSDALQKYRKAGDRLAFVPTMGALHDGHLSLSDIARHNGTRVIFSIFVNPTQFAEGEDFGTYPRDIDRDADMLRGEGVDCLYLPCVDEVYDQGVQSDIRAGDAAKGLESDFRPHFFDGVCSVVYRLFDHVKPDCAVFGEKDYQQLMVIKEMVAARDMGIDVIGAPIIRDADGLALSSRNAYLSAAELEIARTLNCILREKSPSKEAILSAGFDKVDYIEKKWDRILAAAWIGKTRLIDNIDA